MRPTCTLPWVHTMVSRAVVSSVDIRDCPAKAQNEMTFLGTAFSYSESLSCFQEIMEKRSKDLNEGIELPE